MAVVLIPAYKPENSMIDLLKELDAQGAYDAVVVVDDGSGEDFAPVFERMGQETNAELVRHVVNRGKGQALKTGINYIMENHLGRAVVSADCDGQHTPLDILKIAKALDGGTGELIIGSRKLSGKVPWKSKAGNAVMRTAFFLSTGMRVYDTQTGLRGFPAQLLPALMDVKGDRYEYEMNMLLYLAREGVSMREIPIETVYIQNNEGSHFHPVRDALRVFTRIFAFMASSLSSYCVDYLLYAILIGIAGLIPWVAYPIARFVSATMNFTINRNYVFKDKSTPLHIQIIKYYCLAIVVLCLGTFGVGWLTGLGMNQYICKPIVDTLVFVVSFTGQRLLVFKPKSKVVRQDTNGSF